ncbi:MAG: hypothetical protein GHCLOJNM_01581 [bacterium]|nr:hypothetical protein [bacterium]
MRGPKPKSVEQRLAEGSRIRDRRPSPKPFTYQASEVPASLRGDYEARREWTRIAPELERLGLLTVVDVQQLAAYCAAASRWVRANKLARKTLLAVGVRGNPVPHPAVRIAESAAAQMAKLAVEFGFTPMSRERLHVAPPTLDEDELF